MIGKYLYQDLSVGEVDVIESVYDFNILATRELLAKDYVYAIKRLADPKLHSPISGIMQNLIVGFKDYQDELTKWRETHPDEHINLNRFQLEGATAIDDYTLEITIKGKYPQFIYWLAMPFFAPMAWEVDQFYAQEVLKDKNIILDWYPVGTGPYFLLENNPNRRMVLQRNPKFHDEYFPSSGSTDDQENGYLSSAGSKLPFVDTIVFSLEKENIPMWNKFLQGYYDTSGISSDVFDQAIQFTENGEVSASPEIADKGVRLKTTVEPSVFYWGFNMLDPVIGGYNDKNKKLRQAISIVFNVEEYVSIFLNARGVVANGPIPPGIYGHAKQLNPVVYDLFSQQKKHLNMQNSCWLKQAIHMVLVEIQVNR